MSDGEGRVDRLRQSHLQLETLVRNISDGITVQEPDGSLIYANEAAAKMIGFDSVAEVLSTPVDEIMTRFELLDEDGSPFPVENLPGRRVLRGEEAAKTMVRFRRLDTGEERWSLVDARPVYDEQGNLRQAINIFQDVTEQKQALQAERAARARAEEAQQRLEFLARASAILGRSLEYDTTLRRVARLAVPWVADWCAVDLLEEDGSLNRVAVTHVDPQKVELAYELSRRYPSDPDANTGVWKVLRTGDTELYARITDDLLVRSARDEEHLSILRQLQLRSIIVTPLQGRQRIFGALTLASAESGRLFDEQDVTLAEELARRAGMAVDNARLFHEATRLNEQLERRVARRTEELQQKIEEHQLAEKRFRSLLESAPDGMVIVDEAGQIVLVNSQAEKLFGYSREELLGQSVELLMPEGLQERHRQHRTHYHQEPRARPMGRDLDLVGLRKDGSTVHVEISLSPLETAQGLLIITAVRDVSERREAEQRLRASQKELAEAQRIARLGSWRWDVTSNKVTWSEEMYRIYGLAPDAFDGTYEAFLDRIHPEDREYVDSVVRTAFETHQPFTYYERILWPDGTVRILHSHGRVETDSEGNPLYLVGTCQDVTELKQTEQALRQSEALYRSIAHNIPNGAVFVVDQKLRYRLAEGPVLPAIGFGSSAVEGKTIWDVLPAEAAESRAGWYRQAHAGRSVSREVVYQSRTYLLQIAPLTDDQGDIYAALSLWQDITERKEAEETMRALLRLSSKLSATLDLDVLLNMLIEEALVLTRAESGFAGLVTPEGVVTHTYYHQGIAVAIDELWPPGRGVPGWTIGSKAPYQTNNVAEDELVDADFCARFGVRTLLSAPVLDNNGELLAVFEVHNKADGGGFAADDQEKLVGVAQIAAIAIQNAQSYERMRDLSREIVNAQEEERRRLSRELHDSAGQLLTALQINLAMLAGQVSEESALGEQLYEAAEMAEKAHQEIRAASHALRPPALEMVGLDATLQTLCRDFSRQAGLQIEYAGVDVPSIPDQISISFYRFLQETLANVAKHAQASTVMVELIYENGDLRLSVEDDGVGMQRVNRRFSSVNVRGGVGLLGLRERFELIGGEVIIESARDQGTRVTACCPVE
ncbi:MAG TPA: PAS domain S-box protein [Candidatus Sulfomarinibacteraceae bacterium]|nr:PAS domain S-box protein [Candidatus Sulfomarinibacteraceae bacterium]